MGSPLEHRFLKLFEEHGLAVDKQVPLSADEGGRPISTADFVISGSRVVLYIDGAAFHRGQRLRRDRYIRERLQKGNKGWRIEVLRAADLSRGRELVGHLQALSVELGPPRS